MREITFRGKRIDNGEWVEGYFVFLYDITKGRRSYRIYTEIAETDCGDFYPDCFEVDLETVGQFAGLNDKNGEYIFEGDVITEPFHYDMPINGVCVFKDGAFGLEWDRRGWKEFIAFTSICDVEYEIIGNIHDNPELIGGKADG